MESITSLRKELKVAGMQDIDPDALIQYNFDNSHSYQHQKNNYAMNLSLMKSDKNAGMLKQRL
jgi:hypothetical protein